MTKADLLVKMSASELNEWIAYYLLQDEKYRDSIEAEIADSQSWDEKAKMLKQLLRAPNATNKKRNARNRVQGRHKKT